MSCQHLPVDTPSGARVCQLCRTYLGICQKSAAHLASLHIPKPIAFHHDRIPKDGASWRERKDREKAMKKAVATRILRTVGKVSALRYLGRTKTGHVRMTYDQISESPLNE